jgi:hypothetical protein
MFRFDRLSFLALSTINSQLSTFFEKYDPIAFFPVIRVNLCEFVVKIRYRKVRSGTRPSMVVSARNRRMGSRIHFPHLKQATLLTVNVTI